MRVRRVGHLLDHRVRVVGREQVLDDRADDPRLPAAVGVFQHQRVQAVLVVHHLVHAGRTGITPTPQMPQSSAFPSFISRSRYMAWWARWKPPTPKCTMPAVSRAVVAGGGQGGGGCSERAVVKGWHDVSAPGSVTGRAVDQVQQTAAEARWRRASAARVDDCLKLAGLPARFERFFGFGQSKPAGDQDVQVHFAVGPDGRSAGPGRCGASVQPAGVPPRHHSVTGDYGLVPMPAAAAREARLPRPRR